MSLPPKRKEPSLALEVVSSTSQPMTVIKTPEAARIESVNQLLSDTFKRASTLKLSKEENEKLRADFPDSDFYRGAAGNEKLIYIQAFALTKRLNDVLGLGQWFLAVRRSWSEDYRTAAGKQAQRVYIDGALLIRECLVAEAIGDMAYFKDNAAQNYGDAWEGAKTATLRRCTKNFGIGEQAYNKDWCEGWMTRYKGFARPK